jgi:hypothetical protein
MANAVAYGNMDNNNLIVALFLVNNFMMVSLVATAVGTLKLTNLPITTHPLQRTHYNEPTTTNPLQRTHYNEPTTTNPLRRTHYNEPTTTNPLWLTRYY